MPTKILMVCLGNICRSPLAEEILRSKLPEDLFIVDSAGTGAWHIGKQPDERSIEIAKTFGLDISHQRGRQFRVEDFKAFDYIYAMDHNNYNDIIDLAPDQSSKNKVNMILNELFPDQDMDVPDPYFGLHDGFKKVYLMLDESCDIIAKKLKKMHS